MQEEERKKRRDVHASSGTASFNRSRDDARKVTHKLQKKQKKLHTPSTCCKNISSAAATVSRLSSAASPALDSPTARRTSSVSPSGSGASPSSSSVPSTSSSAASRCISSAVSSSSSASAVSSSSASPVSSPLSSSSSCGAAVSSPGSVSSGDETTFAALGLCEELCASVLSLGWQQPTPIQRAVLPVALERRDVVALAETGSGKTAAFALPVLQQLLLEHAPTTHSSSKHSSRGTGSTAMYALVLAPTRELSLQISQHFLALGTPVGCRVATVVGGLDHHSQTLALARKPHVVVGTPGRILDHLQQTKGFSLKSIQVLVLDEADRLLSLDFDATLQELLQHVGHISERQTMLFSATMTTKVSKLQRTSLKHPVKIEVNSKYDVAAQLQQHFVLAPARLKHTHLAAALLHLSPSSVIIFTNTCLNARKTSLFLRHLGLQAVCLHGKMTQPQRIGALTKFRAAQATCLVATEVGSRGLDIPQVEVVINFDVPLSSKEYIHRVGRTARAGRSGRALTIVTQYDVEAYQRIEHALGKKLEELSAVATPEKVMPLHEKVLEALRSAELEAREEEETLLVQKAAKARRKKSSRT